MFCVAHSGVENVICPFMKTHSESLSSGMRGGTSQEMPCFALFAPPAGADSVARSRRFRLPYKSICLISWSHDFQRPPWRSAAPYSVDLESAKHCVFMKMKGNSVRKWRSRVYLGGLRLWTPCATLHCLGRFFLTQTRPRQVRISGGVPDRHSGK